MIKILRFRYAKGELTIASHVWKIAAVTGFVIGGIVALTPYQLAPVCDHLIELSSGKMIPMKCNWMGRIEVIVGLMTMLASLLVFVMKQKTAKSALGVILGLLGLQILIIPTELGIGVCSNAQMPCITTAKFLTFEGSGLLVTSVAAFSSLISRKRNLERKAGSA